MDSMIECVPNVSEGRDEKVISRLARLIEHEKHVRLLNVDTGYGANRTVFTFAGPPVAVFDVTFNFIRSAIGQIDMSKHTGVHPRIGAVDVCPFIPVHGIRMPELVSMVRQFAKKVGEKLKLPVYCYEEAALKPSRTNLSEIRKGQYEGLKTRIVKREWVPDFGPVQFNPKTGIIIIGARKFLVAYNVNLDTDSVNIATEIAETIRESGKRVTENGKRVNIPGKLKKVKAIGWKINEYNKVQVSMNITDIDVIPLYMVYEEVCKEARKRNVRVTGSELVGMIPYNYLKDTGMYFAGMLQRTVGEDQELIQLAVNKLGLNDIKPFDPNKKILEFALGIL